MLGWIPMLTEPSPRGPRISRQSGVTLYAHPMRPESKGQIHVTAADPRRPPAINFNFLSSPPDAELTVCAVRIARAIMTAPAMALFQVSEVVPGADLTTDDEILDWVKQAAETTYHPVGTCKMGSDLLDAVLPRRQPSAGGASLVVAPHAFFGRVDPCQFGATEALSYLSIGFYRVALGRTWSSLVFVRI